MNENASIESDKNWPHEIRWKDWYWKIDIRMLQIKVIRVGFSRKQKKKNFFSRNGNRAYLASEGKGESYSRKARKIGQESLYAKRVRTQMQQPYNPRNTEDNGA